VALTELLNTLVQVDVAFSVVRMETQYGIKHGVATSWLDRLAAPLTGQQAAPDPALVKASDDTLRVPVRSVHLRWLRTRLPACWHLDTTMSGAMPSQRIGGPRMAPSVQAASRPEMLTTVWILC
jgi:hypothetical protein